MESPSRMTIPLDTLRYGHEAEPPINARRTGREVGIVELAASIAAHGLIQALTVREIAGAPYVVDGNRRLAALRRLADEGTIAGNEEIRCDLDVRSIDAEELSVAANIMRLPLHEADQLETFRELSERGLTEGQIASRFGIEPARVRRMLAIGSLSPVILQAWRDDKFERDTVECVKAFTMAASLDDQEKTFHRLEKQRSLYPSAIRRAFGAGNQETARLMHFVGVKDYVAAGGAVVEDLFGDDHAVSDPALARKLADDKMRDKCDKLRAVGWKWAEREDDLPSNWSYAWPKLPVNKKTIKEGVRSKSGCVVRLDYDGNLDVREGIVRPEPAKKDDQPKEDKPATISNALHHRLSTQATLALRSALSEEPDVGIVALLAGFLSYPWDNPIHVKHEGLGHYEDRPDENFIAAFERLAQTSDEGLFQIAAAIAGAALDLQRDDTSKEIFDSRTDVIAASIDQERLHKALVEAFDAEDYFGSVPKIFILTAIKEAIGSEYVDKAKKLKKPELVAYAVKHIPATGWLPPELRTGGYSGPGSVAAVAEAAE